MGLDLDKVKAEATGRWLGIFRSLGIDVREDGKHGPCPMCSSGDKKSDRFRLDRDSAERGTWFCGQCNPRAGDGFSLVQNVLGLDFNGAIQAVSEVVGGCEKNAVPKEKNISPEMLRKIFIGSKPATNKCQVGSYLFNRGLSVVPETLRFHPKCYEPEKKKDTPAMMAVFTSSEGKALTMHRTFLDGHGSKAKIDQPKKILPGLEKLTGGAIRLFDPVDNMIGVAEGIESAIAVKEMMNIPCWSVVSTTLMEGFIPPKGIESVVILADNDVNFAGQRSAYILANKLALKGIKVTVIVPGKPGQDFLDVFNSEKEKQND